METQEIRLEQMFTGMEPQISENITTVGTDYERSAEDLKIIPILPFLPVFFTKERSIEFTLSA